MTPSLPDPPAVVGTDDSDDWQTVRQMGHDLNNLLGIICGYAEMLLEDAPEDGELAADLRRIRETAERAAEVVTTLRGLSRRTTGTMPTARFVGVDASSTIMPFQSDESG
jgi:signal transduction histidine kinase